MSHLQPNGIAEFAKIWVSQSPLKDLGEDERLLRGNSFQKKPSIVYGAKNEKPKLKIQPISRWASDQKLVYSASTPMYISDQVGKLHRLFTVTTQRGFALLEDPKFKRQYVTYESLHTYFTPLGSQLFGMSDTQRTTKMAALYSQDTQLLKLTRKDNEYVASRWRDTRFDESVPHGVFLSNLTLADRVVYRERLSPKKRFFNFSLQGLLRQY